MPHIFRFHKGSSSNILHWKPSSKITSTDIIAVKDKTDVLSSSAGSSIPTPVARMFLFKTAYQLMATTDSSTSKGIYAGLVSESLDLLELLYKSGSNSNLFRFEKWSFDPSNPQFFGRDHGHQLLHESFRQAASQKQFSQKLEITLIYYKEGHKEILIGGTSPFTFVFTSPNFRRKKAEKAFRNIYGLTSNEPLFAGHYKQLHERDASFIWFVEELMRQSGAIHSFEAFHEYVINTRKQHERADPGRFDTPAVELQDIYFGTDIPLTAGGVRIQQISAADYQTKIDRASDFKLDLPAGSPYLGKGLTPLFLYSNMDMDGQYTSPSNLWSNKIMVSGLAYPETTIEEIRTRELPGIDSIQYPFLSKFDIFEKSLVTLPGYELDGERFETLIEGQNFLLPLKPLFFQFFPVEMLSRYVKVSRRLPYVGAEPELTVQLEIPITGPTMQKRTITLKQTYKKDPVAGSEEDREKYPFVAYQGILGIFPFIRAEETHLKYINSYTVASYEKTNDGDPLSGLRFLKKTGIDTVPSQPLNRSNYGDLNMKTTYYQVRESFELIQLLFNKNSGSQSGLIIPKFKPASNGTEEYVYAIDFGTSNTHIEYAYVRDHKAVEIKPFEINDGNMFMTMLNKPQTISEQDGAVDYKDYTAFGADVDAAKVISLREFAPFQVGRHKGATTVFPFRTATFESRSFKENARPNLFSEINIGFSIDRDILVFNEGYQTDLKWQLESNLNDVEKQNRVKAFFRQLLLMIRSHALLNNKPTCNLDLLKIAMSYPTSMDSTLKKDLMGYFSEEMNAIFNISGGSDDPNERLVEVTESIAPYYKLQKTDSSIKHDIYCNIDVGGGTSDIVLVNNINEREEKVLLCYCNSIKFAGKQLWGSVSDDFDPQDNGFVLFFLHLLESKNKNNHEKLKNILKEKNNRTEDVVSYLFGEKDYNFKQIFSECKELKIPLLLHYTSLLYYVAQSCKQKPLALPKTLSFSGKGSEYISLIFDSKEHLKMFTVKALKLFSSLPANEAFQIQQDPKPKEITAQGAVIYAAKPLKKDVTNIFEDDHSFQSKDEMTIRTETEIYLGLLDPSLLKSGQSIYNDFLEPGEEYKSVLANAVHFLDLFFGNADIIKGCERSLNINNLAKYRSFFIDPKQPESYLLTGTLRNSYKSALEEKDMQSPVNDSPFFFAFNTSLIEMSKFIAHEAIKEKSV
ncbi:hypothetical protein [Mucilaginibacter sp. PAMB04168]|uniref:hypothetical protein n=1 Tax=Mucilaginibacter sp. PAMB04168 TaxID=3138567 RepID=UPI0031F674A9